MIYSIYFPFAKRKNDVFFVIAILFKNIDMTPLYYRKNCWAMNFMQILGFFTV